jgi:hypothetical protein
MTKFIPKENDLFWFVNSKGQVCNSIYIDVKKNRDRIAIGNTFHSLETAEAAQKKILTVFAEALK